MKLNVFIECSLQRELYLAARVCIEEAEWSRMAVRGMNLSQGKVDRVLQDPGRGTGPQAARPEPQPLPQCVGEPSTRWSVSNPPPWGLALAHEEGARQEGTGSQNH